MKFKQAIEQTPGIEHAYRLGLQAIRRRDRERISGDRNSRLAGSANLDDALQEIYPNEARWDYGIGLVVNQQADRIVWAEVHPASTSHVKGMINKLKWLKNWLNTCAPRIKEMETVQFCWIASGGVRFSKNSRYAKRLAQSGISFPKEHLDLRHIQ